MPPVEFRIEAVASAFRKLESSKLSFKLRADALKKLDLKLIGNDLSSVRIRLAQMLYEDIELELRTAISAKLAEFLSNGNLRLFVNLTQKPLTRKTALAEIKPGTFSRLSAARLSMS